MTHLVRLSMSLLLALAPAVAGCAKAAPTQLRPTKAGARPIYKAPSTSGLPAAAGAVKGAAYLTSLGAVEPAPAPAADVVAFRVPGRGLMVASADGRDPRAVPGSTADDREPAWTEAGDLLAAVRTDGSGSALVILPPDGRVQRLYASKGTLKQPAALPGGGWLVVEEDGRNGRLLRVDRAGGSPAVLGEAALLGAPTVSPDGASAVVERRAGAGGTELARVALSGGGLVALPVLGPNPRRPAFSPSGRQLAYVTDDGLFVADASGAGGRLVQGGKGFDDLGWHPKGASLIAGARDAGRTDLVRIGL